MTVRIGEIVLHGFPALDRHRVAAAFQQELARLLAAGGVPGAWASAARSHALDAGRFELPPDLAPDTLGERIAQAVCGRTANPGG